MRSRRVAVVGLAAALFAGLATPTSATTGADRSVSGIDPAQFTTTIDNPWFPLVPGTTRIYTGTWHGKPARDVVTVTSGSTTILGVDTVVVRDELSVAGRVRERTLDYYAQDAQGTVWYFGEDTAELDRQGKVVNTGGTWRAGRKHAQAGVVMEAAPVVGKRLRQEYLRGHAEDWYRVIDLSQPVTVPYGSFPDALVTDEWTPLEPGARDRKYYVRGIGQVRELAVKGPNEELGLAEITQPAA